MKIKIYLIFASLLILGTLFLPSKSFAQLFCDSGGFGTCTNVSVGQCPVPEYNTFCSCALSGQIPTCVAGTGDLPQINSWCCPDINSGSGPSVYFTPLVPDAKADQCTGYMDAICKYKGGSSCVCNTSCNDIGGSGGFNDSCYRSDCPGGTTPTQGTWDCFACNGSTCQAATCGNGTLNNGETCDTAITYPNQACGTGTCSGGTQAVTCNATCSGFNYGSCSTTGVVCAAGDQCNNAGTCGTNGICNPTTPVANGTICDADGNACTNPDTCIFGGSVSTCTPGPAICVACGTAAKGYDQWSVSYSGTFCTSGSPVPASPAFPPDQLNPKSWTCGGTTCTAYIKPYLASLKLKYDNTTDPLLNSQPVLLDGVNSSPTLNGSFPWAFWFFNLASGPHTIKVGVPANWTVTHTYSTDGNATWSTETAGDTVAFNAINGKFATVNWWYYPPKPTISLSPAIMDFYGFKGNWASNNTGGQTLTITNTGTGILNWTASVNQPWCHLSLSSGTAAASGGISAVTVTTDVPGISDGGQRLCTINVTSADATNPNQTITASQNVTTCTGASNSLNPVPSTTNSLTVTVSGVVNAASVKVPTWSVINNQDDIIWYPAISAGSNTYQATINLLNHRVGIPDYGSFGSHGYAFYGPTGTEYAGFCGGADFVRSDPPTCNPAAIGTDQMSGCSYSGMNFETLTGAPITGPVLSSPVPASGIPLPYQDWTAGGPNGLPDNFSVRWKGSFNFTAGTYTFKAGSDDGNRLYIDGALVIDKWIGRAYAEDTVSLPLTAGQHTIIYEYFQGPGGAAYSLSWAPVLFPSITLSTASMTFSGVSGGGAPAGQTFTVRNSGAAGSTLKWRATTNANWCFVNGASNGSFWNGADLASGATSPNLTVTMSAPSNTGSPSCQIIVSDNGSSPAATNSPQQITATYNVQPSNVSNVTATLNVCPLRTVSLSWNAAQSGTINDKTYTVYRNTVNNSGTATAINTTALNVTSYTDNPAVGSTYWYWVEANSAGFQSPTRLASVPASVVVSACPVNIAPIATATISKDGITYTDVITVTQGAATPIYLAASSAAGASSDPDGWTHATFGMSGGTAKCDWNRDLNQGAAVFEAPVNTPASASACNISLGNLTFNDPPSTYTYNVLRLTDRAGGVSGTDTVQVTVTAPLANPPGGGPQDPCVENGLNICGVNPPNSNPGGVVCDTVKIAWSDNSSNETGFYVYLDADNNVGNGYIQRYTTAVNATTQTITPPTNNGAYYYFVSAFNAGGESAIIPADNNAISAQACVANLTTSDKDIVAINGSNIGSGLGNQCNSSTEPLPASTQLNLGDKVKFSINLCNSGTLVAGSISLIDSLTNLIIPSTGWNAKYDSGSGEVAISSVGISLAEGGTNPNKTLTFSGIPNVPAPATRRITFEAKLSIPAGFSAISARFQNGFTVTYNAGVISKFTPLILFYTGKSVPTIIEIP